MAGIDANIYQNLQPVQAPSPLDSAQKAMNLSQLGLQNQQLMLQTATQQAMRGAYANNVGPDGKLNQQGFLSDLGKVNPQAAMQYQQQFSKMGKEAAEAKSAQADAAEKTLNVTGPMFDYMAGMKEDERAKFWQQGLQDLKAQGVDVSRMDHPYDPNLFQQYHGNWQNSKQHLANMLTQADIAEKYSNMASAPAKRNAELYGSRSPNAELTSQYDKQAGPIRSSQMAMQQMMDNYKNPSPQGDASLVLNAFKIKFPTAPDVNSLEELSKSQSASDTWKNMAHRVLEGGLDQGTRDNLMRDGVSTFRANVTSLRGIQQKYQDRQQQQNVNDPTLTAEPAIDKTFQDASDLQKTIGPYVPPTERGGLLSSAAKAASRIMGGGSDNSGTAYAAPPKTQVTPQDAGALQWVQDQKNASSPQAFKIRAMLRSKGLMK